ncbi:MAG: hypothetical protein ABS916_09560 [Carnobacterium sp.]|uniref:hypothetical protein n=1 Tax=Carnobacterium sp. TaxID=48221 RepID=UPI003315AC41
MKETFLVIDTETTKEGYNMPNQSVFDIGWTISNRQGEILQTRSYMVEEFRLQALEKKKAFLIDSEVVDKATYITKLLNKEMKVVNWKSIIAQLTKDMNKHNVEFVSAYNLGFDLRVIDKTTQFLLGREFLFDDKFLIDLWHASAYTILNTKEYKEFARKHNLTTEKGNLKTSAESTFQFITNNPSYIEEHTALQDSLDETEILHHLLNQKESIPLHAYEINTQAWKIVNTKEEE